MSTFINDRLIEVALDLPERMEIIWKRRYTQDDGLAEDNIAIWHEGNTKRRIGLAVNPNDMSFVPDMTAPYGLVRLLLDKGWRIV